jgi:hypothetical protein
MLLLAPDTVDLHAPSTTQDNCGWAEPDPGGVVWTGLGNLQLDAGTSDPRQHTAGGSGPYDPACGLSGQLFLPTDAPIAEGVTVECRGHQFIASQVRTVVDPAGSGLDCIMSTVTGVEQWPV